MRLLEFENDKFSVTKDLTRDVPPYAILSHTWGPDTEEVTYNDLLNGAGANKAGYGKIRFCAARAARDGLRHIWVDTCCIDKSNHVELNEAINSMFRWYQSAARCYVYLADVAHDLHWEPEFRNSRWFARGWTLQELLAPASVEFFAKDGRRLGDKVSLGQQVHEITGVASLALQGNALSGFDVEERFRWAATRQTTREEDWAYCLLGIFDVFMPLIYGEGKTSAVRRLRKEISDAASHNGAPRHDLGLSEIDRKSLRDVQSATDPYHDKARIERTKGGLLRDSYRWIFDTPEFVTWRNDPEHKLLWIKGDPGKGKTMLLCGIIDKLTSSDPLSFFFCQATDVRINNGSAVLRGLIHLLVEQQPPLISHVRKKYDDAGEKRYADRNAWEALSEIFASIVRDPALKTRYILIDALDECVEDLPQLLKLVVDLSSESCVKWIVSSRNERNIEEELDGTDGMVRLCLETNRGSISAAVKAYVHHKVDHLALRKKYDASIRHDVQQYLNANADDTFLWVALVCEELAAPKVQKRHTMQILKAFPAGLDPLYQRMLEQIDHKDADLCRQILALLSVAYRPLTLIELMSLIQQHDIGDDLETWADVVGSCGSFLTLREDVVSFVHQSAKDFLFGKAADQIFPCGKDSEHHRVALTSLGILSETLRHDVYDLCAPGVPIDQISPPHTDPLATARYSCIYWIEHLCASFSGKMAQKGDGDLRDGGIVHVFLTEKYLYWLEALSLLRSIPQGIMGQTKLVELSVEMGNQLAEFLRDARRFLRYNKWIIENAPLQVYASALVFAPERSVVRRLFKDQMPEFISRLPQVPAGWDACVQILECHRDPVNAIAFSPDDKMIASGSHDGTVWVWDTATGSLRQVLRGHRGVITAVAFSPESKTVASGSSDKTVRLWDTATGELLHTLTNHDNDGHVLAVAFSPDGKTVATGSKDPTVRLWDAATGEPRRILQGHSNSVSTIAFSPDGETIASGSFDKTIRLWDVATGELRQILDSIGFIEAMTFSSDSQTVASGSRTSIVRLWDVATGTLQHALETGGTSISWIKALVFLPGSKTVAVGFSDISVQLWNTATGEVHQRLEKDVNYFCNIALSCNGMTAASGSIGPVRLWDISTDALQRRYLRRRDEGYVTAVTFSPDGKSVVSGTQCGTVSLFTAATGELQWQWPQRQSRIDNRIVAFTFSPNSKMLAVAWDDGTMRVGDVATGKPCVAHESVTFTRGITFLPDGKTVASGARRGKILFWDAATGELQPQRQRIEGRSGNHMAGVLAFSPDGKMVASSQISEYTTPTVQLRDVAAGDLLQRLVGHSGRVRALAFSSDGRAVASASNDRTVRVWDVATGALQAVLDTGEILTNLSFSAGGQSLRTNRGSIRVVPAAATMRDEISLTTQLFLRREWLVRDGEKLLWFPRDYRPRCTDCYENTFVLAQDTGVLQFLRLTP